MNLEEIVRRRTIPDPWEEGDKIPWDDPAFSRRMLREHLSQEHDRASRRTEIIEHHVGWIHQELLNGKPGRVLDLGCGPGLYTSRLARLGHVCTGFDFSPSSIDYARSLALDAELETYRLVDIRTAEFGSSYDLVMLIFGELNMFSRDDAMHILRKARAALCPGGQVLLEAHSLEYVRAMGEQTTSWRSATSGLFADEPHLILSEHFWHADRLAATQRTFVIHATSARVDRYVETAQAYSNEDYVSLLESAGLEWRATFPAMPGLPASNEFVVLLAEQAEAKA